MLSKLKNMGQSVRDVTAALKQKVTEIQALQEDYEIPETWEEKVDDEGKTYYVDTATGEWYRFSDSAKKQHHRINTQEKIDMTMQLSKKEEIDNLNKVTAEEKEKAAEPKVVSTAADEEEDSSYEDMETDDNDMDIDLPTNDETQSTPISSPISNGNSNSNKTKHKKRSSASVKSRWQCEKCTFENKGGDMECEMCQFRRPVRDETDDNELMGDADQDAIYPPIDSIKEQEEKQGVLPSGSGGDSYANGGGDYDPDEYQHSGHRQMNTIEAIQTAIDQSLVEMGSKEIETLDQEQKKALMTFMEFVEDIEPDPAIKYLRDCNFDIQMAMEIYFREHPDHPKSRQSSMQFDPNWKDQIHAEPENFVDDLPDIHANGNNKRRGSVHDQANLNGNDNARDSEPEILDDEEIIANGGGGHYIPNNQIQNGNQVDYDDHSSDDNDNMQYGDDANLNNGARAEKQFNHNYDQYNPGSHNRMNTEQQIAVAEQISLAHGEYEEKFEEMKEQIKTLTEELKLATEENEKLKIENSNLEEERNRFAKTSQEIQDDWDRMSGYMTQILSEVQYIEDQRKQGQDITTPTPKLHNIFEAIQNTISRNNTDQISINMKVSGPKGGDDDNNNAPDLYENVADLFSEKPPNEVEDEEEDNINATNNADQDVDDDEESPYDSMDDQRVYNYDDLTTDDEDGSEEDGEDKYEADKDDDASNDQKPPPQDQNAQRISTHQRFESIVSNGNLSDPTPISRRGSKTGRKHSRGPSFAFKDLFKGEDDSDGSEDAPSVQSAPEEHDYYAITAYYGIEDDDAATGWDSRRSSMFGDYGRVHSRRQSKRFQETQSEKIKKRFEVDITNKLQQHLGTTDDNNATRLSSLSANGKEPESVADLFGDESKPSKKYRNTTTTITEDPNEDDIDDMVSSRISQTDDVAGLFGGDDDDKPDENRNSGIGMHKPRVTYTGVTALFPPEESSDDSDGSDDGFKAKNTSDDYGKGKPSGPNGWTDEEIKAEIDNLHGPQSKVPRPSSNVALSATFDSIAVLKDRVPKKGGNNESQEEVKEALNNNSTDITMDVNDDRERQEREKQELEQRIEAIREQERNKLNEMQQKLQDEFEAKMKQLRQDIEAETDERLRKELTQSLRPQIENECREAMEQEYDRKLNEKLNERFDSELKTKLDERSNELTQSFQTQIDQLKEEMNERATSFEKEKEIMTKRKIDLIQQTSKEIDALRTIIRNHGNAINQVLQNQSNQNQNNLNNMLGGLLKWG